MKKLEERLRKIIFEKLFHESRSVAKKKTKSKALSTPQRALLIITFNCRYIKRFFNESIVPNQVGYRIETASCLSFFVRCVKLRVQHRPDKSAL